ncbi:MAG TPA: protein kinase [Solirubrobacteraceae bacterium]|jgi:serine/threonine-protein kinase|nr:protein kinase [Solirubrobacteraceae bacterium]
MERPGTVLAGRYRVVRHAGSGGTATVYLAHDEVLDRDVAVKAVHAEPQSEHGRRIMREARLGAGLRHPHLVTVYDVVPQEGAILLVTEYVAGQTLADALRRGPLDPPRALAVLRAVASALDHAHERGIVHRDVKPANVLLGESGAVKLADLGIATAEDVTRITRTGGALGTVAYMAPEQFEPGPATPAADVYALAAVAFEALAGRRPYPGATAFEVFERLRAGATPPDVSELRPELPAAVGAVLRRGLASDPAERPAAGELVAELEAALEPEGEDMPAEATRPMAPAAPPSHSPALPPRRRPRRSLVPLALLAAAGAAVAVVVASSRGGDDDAGRRAELPRSAATATQPKATAATRPAPRPRAPTTPVATVRAFYERAAEGDLAGAWRLAGPRMRAAFGNSLEVFSADLGSLRSITFRRLAQTGTAGDTSTVALETVAEHTDRTERCTGTVQTVRGASGRWLVEPHAIRCAPV